MAETKVNLDMEPEEELVFQDIPHDVKDKTAVTPSSVQTHTFTNFPEPGDSDEDTDKADLLSGNKKQPSFWTFEYYQTFFDVDTHQVLLRILGSMYPNPRKNYLQTYIRPNPDMYGPFWICTTLVFTTAIAGNMANYIEYAGRDYQWRYDFHKVTFAASAIFAYWWIVPTLLYVLLWKRGSQAGFSFLEIICVYGYSLAIYIPISILWVIRIPWLQWLLVLLGMILSGSVLVLTFWPAVRNDDKKVAYTAVAGILLFHGLLAAGFVLYFFHVPALAAPDTINPAVSVITGQPQVTTPNMAAWKNVNQNVPGSLPSGLQALGQQQQAVRNAGGSLNPSGVGVQPLQSQQVPVQSPGFAAQHSNIIQGQAAGVNQQGLMNQPLNQQRYLNQPLNQQRAVNQPVYQQRSVNLMPNQQGSVNQPLNQQRALNSLG